MTETVFHIPHSSVSIPDEFRDDFCLSDTELSEEIRLMTDWHTSELFGGSVQALGKAVEFPVSRLLVDPERFPNDDEESMSKVGMGVLYTLTSHGEPLRHTNMAQGERRKRLIDEFYHPHHTKLQEITEQALDKAGQALIIDCHSFPSIPLPYEPEQDPERPDICLGTDQFHTPLWLLDKLRGAFEKQGYDVQVNKPFAGTLTPLRFYRSDKRVSSIMIEVNRSLYMDESTALKSDQFEKVSQEISQALKTTLKVNDL